MSNYDAIVIGAGPGGYPAAILSARAGLKTALIEKEKPGGTCLQIGCIPSKILLDAGKRHEHMIDMEKAGVLNGTTPHYDYPKLIGLSRERIAAITGSLAGLIESSGVSLIRGVARFVDQNQLAIDTGTGKETINGKYIIIACGARAAILKGIPYPHPRVWTNREALTTEEKPEKIIIIGGGAIGCEFATFFASMQIPTTIVELEPRLLPMEDIDSSRELQASFRKRKIAMHTGRKAASVEAGENNVRVTLDDGTRLEGSHLLVAVGIQPQTADLGLEHAGITTDSRGFIPVALPEQAEKHKPVPTGTPFYETNVKRVYAIGDIIAIPGRAHLALAHVASAEAEVAIAHITGKETHAIDYDNVPRVTFTTPEVASVGLTEEQARAKPCPHPGHEIRAEKISPTTLGLATALNLPEGKIKIVIHRDTFNKKPIGRIVGAHLVHEKASESIHVLAEAIHAEDSTRHMKRLVIQHPTWSEPIGEVLRKSDNEAVHVLGGTRK